MGVSERKAVSLNENVRRVLDGKNFASVATLSPDGGPQSSIVWVDREGDCLVFSTASHRQKARNLKRDPRISVSIFDLENPYYSVEIRGVAELIEDRETALPARLSQKYLGQDPPPEPGVVRLIVRVTPLKINEFSP